MDEKYNKSEEENLNKKIPGVAVTDSANRCGSPVFKCINHAKGIRVNNLDSSDYDIPSYQINQSAKSRTSNKYGSETSESVLPFSPIFSPIPITTTAQFQPPAIHSLGTVAKISDKSCKNNGNGFPSANRYSTKACGLFESLGMNDKDISWVSSMASPPPKQVPGSQFNTIEKATFLPEEKFQNIQPRALFSPNLDDDFGCHPISFCSESEDEEAYRSNIRLSDVCATLRQLEVRSLDLQSDHSVENLTLQENSFISPVIRTKKPESAKKKKKSVLVVSPDDEHKYEFLLGENKILKCDKQKSGDGSNFIEDDSFQSMSFSGIDELCKTLVTEESKSSEISKSGECDKTLTNSSLINCAVNIPKLFYNSKSADVYEVSSVTDLHSYIKSLEEGDLSISVTTKIDKSVLEKGIVRFDVLNKDFAKIDATKRLHSEVTEEKDDEKMEKLIKMDNESTEWEKMKQYLSESQLNVSEGEIFRTVENLEKTLASQESRERSEVESSQSQSSFSTTSKANSEKTKEEEEEEEKPEHGDEIWNADTVNSMPSITFTNDLGSRISISRKGLKRGREILRDCEEGCSRQQTVEFTEKEAFHEDRIDISISDLKKQNSFSIEAETPKETFEESKEKEQTYCCSKLKENIEEVFFEGFSTGTGKKIQVSAKALEKAKTLMRECDEAEKETSRNNFPGGFSTGNGKKIKVSAKAFEKAKALMKECDEAEKETSEKCFVGFSTGTGKKIQVSAEALEKAKALMKECDEAEKETSEKCFVGFSTGTGKKIQVSAEALEKANALMIECNENPTEKRKTVEKNYSTCSDQNVETSAKVLEKEKTDCESGLRESRERTENSWMKGFTTSSGKEIRVSAKAFEKAKALMRECDESSEETSKRVGKGLMGSFSTYSGRKIQVSAKALEKAKALMMECDENKGEKPKLVGTGFSRSGAKIQVSAKALEKAKTLWADCEENENDSHSVLKCFSTYSEKSVSASGEAFEKAKALTSNVEHELNNAPNKAAVDSRDAKTTFGFSTASGSEVKVSEEALEKVKLLRYKNQESIGEAEETEMKKKGLAAVRDVTEDWEEIIPSWLHVYTTSPLVVSDRADISPLLFHEDGQSSTAAREYIVKSPVLGASDRFHGKRKRRRLRFEEEEKIRTDFEIPYKVFERKAGGKRTSKLAMDFSVPFKKAKFTGETEVVAGHNVKEDRAKKREEQERTAREKIKVKPSEGSHLRRKSSQKQKSWMEAVCGSSPEVYSEETLKSFGVREDVLRVTIKNAVSFTFSGDFFGPNCEENVEGVLAGDGCVLILNDENRVGASECKRSFLASPGVQPSLVPEGWVENHYKWIVWKLAHYETSFPQHFAGRGLTPDNVMLQLKYRYDREIDGSERSALKKILERDDTSAKRLVLCVCGIEKIEVGDGFNYELSLTDGWYSCTARVDPAMAKILDEGKLSVGTKLMTQGAVLVNCEQGVSPLEISGDVHLRISTNSTRRIRWDAKLGFQKNPRNFPVSLGSILAQGGPISRIDVIIVRVYPVLYMEKTSDGCHVTRNRRSEEKAEAEYRKLQEQKIEAICSEVRMEVRNSVDSEKKGSRVSLNNLEHAEDMCELMGSSSGPSSLQELMMADQRKVIENFLSNQSDRLSRELSEKIEKKLEKENLRKRNVSELFRAKIVDLRKPDYNNPAVLSVWHPNEDLIALLSEGKVVSLTNVTISNSSRVCKPLQINTSRHTQYFSINRSVKYPSRKVTSLRDASSKVSPVFEEVDVVGIVVLVRDISYGSRMSQVVYLTDAKGNFAGVVFWGSCKNYGWENALRVRCVVACTNLQWKKNLSPQDVPSLYVNENSVFTENPKQSYMKEEMEKLKQTIPQNVSDFLSKCEEDLLAKLEESKWRSNLQRMSSAPKSGAKGFDGFESRPAASSTPIKPFSSSSSASFSFGTTTTTAGADDAEPSPIQKRIERLQSYGEPPSLLPLIVRNNMRRRTGRRKSSLTSTSH